MIPHRELTYPLIAYGIGLHDSRQTSINLASRSWENEFRIPRKERIYTSRNNNSLHGFATWLPESLDNGVYIYCE